MCKKYIYFMGLFLIITWFVKNTAAYNDEITHPDITKRAVENSQLDQYLKNSLGFKDDLDTEGTEAEILIGDSIGTENCFLTGWLRSER